MFQITTYTATSLPKWIAERCAETLCKPGGEIAAMFHGIANHECDEWGGARIAIATRTDEADNAVPIGWATLTQWNGSPALQASVFPSNRHLGLASAMVASLTVLGDFPLSEVSVFHPRLVNAAKRAGFKSVSCWVRTDDGWVRGEN